MLANISSSLTAGLFDGIKNLIKLVTNIPNIFSGLFKSLLTYIYCIFYYIFCGVAWVMNFAELLFRKFAGLEPILTNDGKELDLFTVFLQDSKVWSLFVSIIVLSIVLLMLFTFIAIIKSEFSLDIKGSAKGPIIARALKSFAMFLIVPAVSVMGVYAVNAITQTVNAMFKDGDEVPMANQVWAFAVRNANRARTDSDFRKYISGGSVDGYSLGNNTKNRHGGQFNNPDTVADAIDLCFKKEYVMQGDSWENLGFLDKADSGLLLETMLFLQPYSPTAFNPWNAGHVNYYYIILDIDYLLGIASGLYLSLVLLFMAVPLIKRIIEMVILLLLAPPMVAMAPLDGGSAQKKWQGEFIKRVLAVVGPVFAINMYFVLTPVIQNIAIFTGGTNVHGITKAASSMMGAISIPTVATGAVGTVVGVTVGVSAAVLAAYEAFFQIIVLCVGMQIVKSASALFCNLLGVEDIAKAGMDGAKKAVGTAAKIGVAAVGGAMAAKALDKAKEKQGEADAGYSAAQGETQAAKDQLADAQASGDQNRIAEAQKKVNSAERAEEAAKLKRDEAKENTSGYEKAHKEAKQNLIKTTAGGVASTFGISNVDALADTVMKGRESIKDAAAGKGDGQKATKEQSKKKRVERQFALEDEIKASNQENQNNVGVALDGGPDAFRGMGASAHRQTAQVEHRTATDFNRRMAAIRRNAGGSGINDDQREWLQQHGIAEADINNTGVVDAARTRAVNSAAQYYRQQEATATGLEAKVTRLDSATIEALKNAILAGKFNADGSVTANGTTLSKDEIEMLSGMGRAETTRRQAEATQQGNVNKKIQEMMEEETAAQIIEARRTGNADSAVEGSITAAFDRNALGDAVQQGIEESISRLKSAIADALRSSKLDVKGLSEVKAQILKNAQEAAKAKLEGKSDDDVAKILQDGLDRLTKTVGGK